MRNFTARKHIHFFKTKQLFSKSNNDSKYNYIWRSDNYVSYWPNISQRWEILPLANGTIVFGNDNYELLAKYISEVRNLTARKHIRFFKTKHLFPKSNKDSKYNCIWRSDNYVTCWSNISQRWEILPLANSTIVFGEAIFAKILLPKYISDMRNFTQTHQFF